MNTLYPCTVTILVFNILVKTFRETYACLFCCQFETYSYSETKMMEAAALSDLLVITLAESRNISLCLWGAESKGLPEASEEGVQFPRRLNKLSALVIFPLMPDYSCYQMG